MILMNNFPAGQLEICDPKDSTEMLTAANIKKYHMWMTNHDIQKWDEFLKEETLDAELFWPLSDDLWNYSKVLFYFLVIIFFNMMYYTV